MGQNSHMSRWARQNYLASQGSTPGAPPPPHGGEEMTKTQKRLAAREAAIKADQDKKSRREAGFVPNKNDHVTERSVTIAKASTRR